MIGLLLVGARHAVPFFVGQAFLPVLFVMPVLLVGPRCSCEHTNADVSRYKVPGCLPFCARLLFATPPAACHSEFACEFRHHARSVCLRDGSYQDLVVKDSERRNSYVILLREGVLPMQPDQAKFLLDFLLPRLK